MKRENSENIVIAVTGPSGVGKSTTVQKIKEVLKPLVEFTEPVVATTRAVRHDDGSARLAGLTDDAFARMIASGIIVLPHRPFRRSETAQYGFMQPSLTERPLLTEVHSSVLPEFRTFFASRKTHIIGLVACESTLAANISKRQTTPDPADMVMRLEMGMLEVEEITRAHASGIIDHTVVCEPDIREDAQRTVVANIRNFLENI